MCSVMPVFFLNTVYYGKYSINISFKNAFLQSASCQK